MAYLKTWDAAGNPEFAGTENLVKFIDRRTVPVGVGTYQVGLLRDIPIERIYYMILPRASHDEIQFSMYDIHRGAYGGFQIAPTRDIAPWVRVDKQSTHSTTLTVSYFAPALPGFIIIQRGGVSPAGSAADILVFTDA